VFDLCGHLRKEFSMSKWKTANCRIDLGCGKQAEVNFAGKTITIVSAVSLSSFRVNLHLPGGSVRNIPVTPKDAHSGVQCTAEIDGMLDSAHSSCEMNETHVQAEIFAQYAGTDHRGELKIVPEPTHVKRMTA